MSIGVVIGGRSEGWLVILVAVIVVIAFVVIIVVVETPGVLQIAAHLHPSAVDSSIRRLEFLPVSCALVSLHACGNPDILPLCGVFSSEMSNQSLNHIEGGEFYSPPAELAHLLLLRWGHGEVWPDRLFLCLRNFLIFGVIHCTSHTRLILIYLRFVGIALLIIKSLKEGNPNSITLLPQLLNYLLYHEFQEAFDTTFSLLFLI